VNPRIQKWLVTGLAALITSALGRLFSDKIMKEAPPPQQRSFADDTKEAVFHAVVSLIGVVVASAIVRWIADRSQA
jgi:hypothetical protein